MKNIITISTLASLALAALATPASAQPVVIPVQEPMPAPMGPAPMEPAPMAPAPGPTANDTSTLNGQLVPVGDQNAYRYSYKKTIVSTNPLGWILGSYGVSLSYALSGNIAIRGDANYYDSDDSQGAELGVGLPIYFRKVYLGLFIEPGIITRALKSEYSSETAQTFGPQVLVGYHWYYDSGFNISAAVGIGRNWNNNSSDEFSSYDETFANGYLRFGYAF